MDTMYERCCGLDIHKKTIEACFRSGKKKTHMSFGTTSAELRKLTMWLVENDCQSVAMESTGSYWKWTDLRFTSCAARRTAGYLSLDWISAESI